MGRDSKTDKIIAAWLLICCALVFVTLVQGGVTRLTRSGLSIVEWKPVSGVVPPLTASQWSETFEKYKATPEYRLENQGMSLDEFKSIFWREWSHRVLARATGLAFLLPFLYFALSGQVAKRMVPRFVGMAALVAFQGALGWYMVYSGLVKDPRVSHYRLTSHLLVACAFYSLMFWSALDLLFPRSREGATANDRLKRMGIWVIGLLSVTIASGGLVAGLKAGFLYGTFPLMGGHWLPVHMFELRPVALNFLENRTTVQFDHRILGMLTGLAVCLFWLKASAKDLPSPGKTAVHVLPFFLALQIALGVLTLVYSVPVPLAASHQANALILLTLCLSVQHRLC